MSEPARAAARSAGDSIREPIHIPAAPASTAAAITASAVRRRRRPSAPVKSRYDRVVRIGLVVAGAARSESSNSHRRTSVTSGWQSRVSTSAKVEVVGLGRDVGGRIMASGSGAGGSVGSVSVRSSMALRPFVRSAGAPNHGRSRCPIDARPPVSVPRNLVVHPRAPLTWPTLKNRCTSTPREHDASGSVDAIDDRPH